MTPTAFITGASSGIGLALSQELAARGYRVAMTARRGDLLEQHAEQLRQGGAEAMALAVDGGDKEAVRDAVAHVQREWGPIDLAIANAGLGSPTPADDFPLDEAEKILHINVNGVLYLFDAVVPDMIARKNGRFVGMASLAGLRGLPSSATYSASKAAVQTFLEGVRCELARHHVGVTIINPGFVKTPMTDKNDFPMPFLMPVERAARIMADGIAAGKREIDFPLPMSLAMRVFRVLPNPVYDAIARIMLAQASR